MAFWEVHASILRDWEPGQQIDVSSGDPPDVVADHAFYLKWMRRHRFQIEVLLLLLASNATVVNGSLALTFTSVETMSKALHLGERQTQRWLARLKWMREIDIVPCDGRACRKRHGDTNHIYIPRPPASTPWEWAGASRNPYHRGRKPRI